MPKRFTDDEARRALQLIDFYDGEKLEALLDLFGGHVWPQSLIAGVEKLANGETGSERAALLRAALRGHRPATAKRSD